MCRAGAVRIRIEKCQLHEEATSIAYIQFKWSQDAAQHLIPAGMQSIFGTPPIQRGSMEAWTKPYTLARSPPP